MLYSWFAARYSGLGQRVYTFDVSRQKDSQYGGEGKSYLRNLRFVYLKVFLAHLLGFIQLLDGYRPQTVISVRLTASSAAGKLAQSWIQYLIDAWAGLASSSHETSSAGPSLSAVRGCRVYTTVAVVYSNQQEEPDHCPSQLTHFALAVEWNVLVDTARGESRCQWKTRGTQSHDIVIDKVPRLDLFFSSKQVCEFILWKSALSAKSEV